MLAFYWGTLGKWVLADVDMHTLFVKDGHYLNAGELTECVRRSKPRQSPL